MSQETKFYYPILPITLLMRAFVRAGIKKLKDRKMKQGHFVMAKKFKGLQKDVALSWGTVQRVWWLDGNPKWLRPRGWRQTASFPFGWGTGPVCGPSLPDILSVLSNSRVINLAIAWGTGSSSSPQMHPGQQREYRGSQMSFLCTALSALKIFIKSFSQINCPVSMGNISMF